MELQQSCAMADCVHVFRIINLTVLAEWNCVKQYIFRLVCDSTFLDNLDTARMLYVCMPSTVLKNDFFEARMVVAMTLRLSTNGKML